MKKISLKFLGIAAAASALLVLAGCGGNNDTAPESTAAASTAAQSETAQALSAGTLLLSVNPAIELDYDMSGDVVALNGLNADGRAVLEGYSGYEGRPAEAVAAELVGEIDAAGYFDTTVAGNERNIVLKLERGSESPDGFLTGVEQAVRQAVSERGGSSRPVAIGEDDYSDDYADRGYISSSAAERLVATQAGVSNPQFVVKEYELDDGDYEVELIIDGVEYEYEVDAYTGRVTEVERDDDAYGDDDWYDDGWDDDDWDDDDWDDDDWDDDDWDDDDWDDDDWDDDDWDDDDWDDDDWDDDDWDDDDWDD